RHALRKQLTRAGNQVLHERNVARVEAAPDDVFFGEAVRDQRFERNVDATLFKITPHILPEICKLERGAGGVGKLLALGIAITAKIKNKASHGIRRIPAVAEHAAPGGIAVN